MELVSEDLLVRALSPEPRDFTNLSVRKTFEKVVDGRYHVGFEVFVIMDGTYPFDENFTDVLFDKGYCVFTPGNDFDEDYVSEEEKILNVDDPSLPDAVREAWVAHWLGRIDVADAEEFLDGDQADSSATVRALCQQVIDKVHGGGSA
jgi:hypothetical protein